ncbi:MAG: AEC family transporter [Chitinispirillaceae bacterium]|nr:AEC family transporter [Chitinispirillaceae bacterium]
MTLQIILAIAEIFGLFMIGAIARKLGYITDSEITRWSCLVMDFLMPPFMFVSIVKGFNADRLQELWVLPAVGIGMVLFFTLAGYFLRFGLRSDDPDMRRTFLHLCAVNNSTFLPTIILRNLWGEALLSNLFLLYLGGAVGVWSFGVGMLGGASFKQTLRNILTPTLIAIFCAVAVAATGTREFLPGLLMNILGRVGSIAVPLMLILTGASLAHRGIVRFTWQNLYIAVVRIIILPLLTIPILWLLHLPEDIYAVAVIVALMPSAISSVIMTRRFGGNSDYAATTALITTTCCMITAPLGVWLFFGR